MSIRVNKPRTLLGLAGLLALSNCATTQETVQECKQAAFAFCERTVRAKGASAGGAAPADAAARDAAYQQCLDVQLTACRAQ